MLINFETMRGIFQRFDELFTFQMYLLHVSVDYQCHSVKCGKVVLELNTLVETEHRRGS